MLNDELALMDRIGAYASLGESLRKWTFEDFECVVDGMNLESVLTPPFPFGPYQLQKQVGEITQHVEKTTTSFWSKQAADCKT